MTRVAVLGAGTMGIGVAQTFATHGHEVVLVDLTDAILATAREEIAGGVRMLPLLRPGTSPVSTADVLSRIHFTTDVGDVAGCRFVVENVTERWTVKKDLYPLIDRICGGDCVFGVNTSAIPITRVAALTGRPSQVVGVHFMNPVPLKPTVEVIRGAGTSDETIATTRALVASIDKASVVVNDSAGFVTNRILMLTVNEAVQVLAEGVAQPADIDRLCRESFGHAMGPLATADLIGLDTVLLSLEVLHDHLGDEKFRPCPLLRSLVDDGVLGQKTGHGFFSYASGRLRPAELVEEAS